MLVYNRHFVYFVNFPEKTMDFNQIDEIVEDGAYGGCSPEFAKTVGRNISTNHNKNKFASLMAAKMEASAAGDAFDIDFLNQRADELWPQFPYQPYPTHRRLTAMAEVHIPPVDRGTPPKVMCDPVVPIEVMSDAVRHISDVIAEETERQLIEMIDSDVTGPPVPNNKTFEDQVADLNRQITELKEQIFQLQNANTAAETTDEINVRMVRTKIIISEVSFDKKLKKLELEDLEEIERQVGAKIQSDRDSADYDIYQRNQALLQHLMRRKKYSKSAYKMLKQFWILLGVSGDLMGFTGQLFDRDYLNPKSDKYYRYVSILTFMLKYQRLSKKHTKLWFKDVKDHDKDDYFFDNWQHTVTHSHIVTDV
jgi:hypothetical protein